MRIFHIISRLDVGGAERVAIDIASSRSGAEHHIVELMRGRGAYAEATVREVRQRGITLHRAALPVVWRWHYTFERLTATLFPLRMAWLWLRWRPDIVHCHTEMPDLAVWLSLTLCPWIRPRVVRTIHNTRLWDGLPSIARRVEPFMQSRRANIAISPNVADAYAAIYGERPPIIYNGVAPVAQRPYPGIVAGKVNVCFAGRFEEQKGVAMLVGIIRTLAADSRYHFHIFGSGRQQTLVDTLRPLPNVTINPPLPGLAAYLASFDYLLMPSEHEGLSILAIEASMNGLPILASHCAGLIDTLPPDWPLVATTHDEWLRLFHDTLPSRDTDAHSLLAAKAKAYAMEHFSLETMQRGYQNIAY